MWSPDVDDQTLVSGERRYGQRDECRAPDEQNLVRMNEDFRLGPTLPPGPGGTRAPSRGTMFSDVVAIASKPASTISNRTAPANVRKQFLIATEDDGACGERGRGIIAAGAAATAEVVRRRRRRRGGGGGQGVRE